MLISDFKTLMNQENIEDYFLVKQITYGTGQIIYKNDPNSCNSQGTYFLIYGFWQKDDRNFIKKYDNCGGFNSLEFTHSNPIKFFKDNIELLKKEEVKTYRTKLYDSIVGNKRYSFIATQSHSPLRFFWFHTNSNEFEKNYNTFDLTTKSDNKNINYQSNNDLEIVKLNMICEEIIDNINQKESFSRLK